jgi:hypothetical protein
MIKNSYPLKENNNQLDNSFGLNNLDISIGTIKNPNALNVNDISAFQDDSMIQERALLGNREDMGPDYSAIDDESALQGGR